MDNIIAIMSECGLSATFLDRGYKTMVTEQMRQDFRVRDFL